MTGELNFASQASHIIWHCRGFCAGVDEALAEFLQRARNTLSQLVAFKHRAFSGPPDCDPERAQEYAEQIERLESRLGEVIDFLDAGIQAAQDSGSSSGDEAVSDQDAPHGTPDTCPAAGAYPPPWVAASRLPRS